MVVGRAPTHHVSSACIFRVPIPVFEARLWSHFRPFLLAPATQSLGYTTKATHHCLEIAMTSKMAPQAIIPSQNSFGGRNGKIAGTSRSESYNNQPLFFEVWVWLAFSGRLRREGKATGEFGLREVVSGGRHGGGGIFPLHASSLKKGFSRNP